MLQPSDRSLVVGLAWPIAGSRACHCSPVTGRPRTSARTLTRNPADTADPPKRSASQREIRAWNAETLRTFLQLTKDDTLNVLWVMLATIARRRGEALGQRWHDVDVDTARARVTQTVSAIGWELHFGQPKTAAGRRPIAS